MALIKQIYNGLQSKLRSAGFVDKPAYQDADSLIVTSVREVVDHYGVVAIVVEDIDSLVLMSGMDRVYEDVYFLKPNK